MIEGNAADPRSRAWAEKEFEWQREERRMLGYDAICLRCGRQGPTAWMIDGVCSSRMPGVCAVPSSGGWRYWWDRVKKGSE